MVFFVRLALHLQPAGVAAERPHVGHSGGRSPVELDGFLLPWGASLRRTPAGAEGRRCRGRWGRTALHFQCLPQCLLSCKCNRLYHCPGGPGAPRRGGGWMASLPVCLRGACSLSTAFPTVTRGNVTGRPAPCVPRRGSGTMTLKHWPTWGGGLPAHRSQAVTRFLGHVPKTLQGA